MTVVSDGVTLDETVAVGDGEGLLRRVRISDEHACERVCIHADGGVHLAVDDDTATPYRRRYRRLYRRVAAGSR